MKDHTLPLQRQPCVFSSGLVAVSQIIVVTDLPSSDRVMMGSQMAER